MENNTIFSEKSQSQLYKSEDAHFWFKTRAKFIIDRLKHLGLLRKEYQVAEIGCGNGYTSSKLINHYSHYHALEGTESAIANMQLRLNEAGLDSKLYTLTVADLTKYEFNKSYDLVFAFDVLEHIDPKDLAITLKIIYQALSTNGKFVITVPAFNWLWTSIDVQAGHFQRFDRKSLEELLSTNGFKVNYYSYMFLAVLPFYILQRYLLNLKHGETAGDSHLEINPILNTVLHGLTMLDFMLVKLTCRLGLGSSLFCVASK